MQFWNVCFSFWGNNIKHIECYFCYIFIFYSVCKKISNLFQVTIEKIKSVGSGERKREIVGVETFPTGTTANETCTKVAEKYGANMGIWLLQRKVHDPENHADVEDGCYITVRNSKLQLEQGQDYSAVYFSGSQMFIFG